MTTKLSFELNEIQFEAFKELLETDRVTLTNGVNALREALPSILDLKEQTNVILYLPRLELQLALVEEMLRAAAEQAQEKQSKIII